MRHTAVKTCRTLCREALVFALLILAPLASASPPMPRMLPEAEPAGWQRAGIEGALNDPALWVQINALDYCTGKKWITRFHISAEQWLLWLGHSDWNVQSVAAQAAAQLEAQMPPEVQRALVRLQNERSTEHPAALHAAQALCHLGSAMIPEVQQAELACLQMADTHYEFQECAREALGQMGAAMPPVTLQALLALVQAGNGAQYHAADALARLGGNMPPQVRELMLGVLLDPHADTALRCTAVEAMGRLGPQMPPQAQEFLLSVMRDQHADKSLRYVTPAALAKLGPRITPVMLQAVSASYDGALPPEADRNARIYHTQFQVVVADALEQLGPDMPVAVQQLLLARFLNRTRTPEQSGSPPQNETRIDAPALHALGRTGLNLDPAVLHAILDELRVKTFSSSRQVSIQEFYQMLAKSGLLPPPEQRAVLALLQDESADFQVRGQAALTLGMLGAQASQEAKCTLLVILQNQKLPHSLRYSALLAMEQLGPHMPLEAGPVLVGIVQRNTVPRPDPATPPGAPSPAAVLPAGADPFGPSAPAPATETPRASAAGTYSIPDEFPVEHAVPALGNLGAKMPAEAQAALLGVIQHQAGTQQTPWDAAYALAQMGDKLPPQTQQRLLALLNVPGQEYGLRLAIRRTLGVSGIHPVEDAQVADLLAKTYAGEPDAELCFYLYLWLGRSPAHLQAVRWLGHQTENPPLGETTPQEILSLISRLWPHAATHADLRHEMARRSSQLLTAHLKNRPLDAATRQVLRTLAAQLAEDPAAECATALGQVQAALAAEEKAR